jgi:hypothetical protein
MTTITVTGRLEVTRQTQLFASVHVGSVAVYGKVVGKLRSGGELRLDLAPGQHSIVVECQKGKTSGQFSIGAGRTATCHVTVSKFNSALKVEIDD